MNLTQHLNGEWTPSDRATVSLFDRGFAFGDGVTDSLRTFAGRPFAVEDHVERLFRSLKFVRIAPPVEADQLIRLTNELCDRNASARGPNDDFWVIYYLSREGTPNERVSPTSTWAIACTLIDFTEHARSYIDGHALTVPWVRQLPHQVQPARLKTLSRLHLTLAQLEAAQLEPGSTALLLDLNGDVAETVDGNVFAVSGRTIVTPTHDEAIEGVTQAVTLKLARELGHTVEQRRVQLYDLLTADEVFLTSTGYCVLPVTRINGLTIGNGQPGPITTSLLDAWTRLVGIDITAQALASTSTRTTI
jgi:branched-chain amino acid aminotransferase